MVGGKMTIKIVKLNNGSSPLIMGEDRLPASYQAPAREFVEQYSYLMTPCQPYSFASLASRVRSEDDSLDARVDADLMDDFHEESVKNKPRLGATLYRLDNEMLPA